MSSYVGLRGATLEQFHALRDELLKLMLNCFKQ